jgi:hypothetical protein
MDIYRRNGSDVKADKLSISACKNDVRIIYLWTVVSEMFTSNLNPCMYPSKTRAQSQHLPRKARERTQNQKVASNGGVRHGQHSWWEFEIHRRCGQSDPYMWSPNGGNAAVSSPGGALLPSFLTRSCVPAPVELGGGSSLEVAAAALSAAAEDQTGKWRPLPREAATARCSSWEAAEIT